MNPKVNEYLIDGCGRCELHATPGCKVNNWRAELKTLRSIVLESELNEELKWSVPCYTINGKNVLILSALKEFVSISFFKGALLSDPENLLHAPGKNSQAARMFKFTSIKEIKQHNNTIKAYIKEAIEIEKSGKKIAFKKTPEAAPKELLLAFEEIPELKKAFYALTPGRQRGYILYFSAAKQSKTRHSRIEKYIPKIIQGKGFHD